MPHLNGTRRNIAKNIKFLFLQGFLTFISIVNCQYYGPPVPPQYQNEILNPPDASLFPKVNEGNPSNSYHFSYVAPDETGGYHTRHEMRDPNGRVTGSYTINDNGILRRVDYIADEYGYRAVVRTNEPGTTSHQPSGVNFQSVHNPTAGNFQQRKKRDVSIPSSPRLARKSGYLSSYINYRSDIENSEKHFPHQPKITSGKDMPAPFFRPVEISKTGDTIPIVKESYPYPPTKSYPTYPPYPPTKSHPTYPPYPPTKSHPPYPPYPPYPPTKSHPPYPPTYPPSPPTQPPSPPTQPPSPPTQPPSPPTHPPTPPTQPPSPPTHPPSPPTQPPSPPTYPPSPPTQPPSPPTYPPSPPTQPPSPPTYPPSPPTQPPSPPTYPPSPPTQPPSPPTYPPLPPPPPPPVPPKSCCYPPSPPLPPPVPPKSCCYPPSPSLPPIQISKSIYFPQPMYPPLPPTNPKSVYLPPPSTNNQNFPSFYPEESQPKSDYPNKWNYEASPYWNKMYNNHDAYQGKSQMFEVQGNILPDLIFPNHQHLRYP